METRNMVSFDALEHSKENIEPSRQGKSAAALAQAFERDVASNRQQNNSERTLFEEELSSADEVDDPLEIWVRYIEWTEKAYPQGHSTESGLIQLLERCTRTFHESDMYLNDPRYLKVWMQYTRFCDAPREVFVFLAKKGIGKKLSTFYEQFASLLETLGRKREAEQIYLEGLENQARPVERLKRRFDEFKRRNPGLDDEIRPDAPSGEVRRKALGVKDESGELDPLKQEKETSSNSTKIAIYSDSDGATSSTAGANGWATIGTIASRRKENHVEAKPWVGERLVQHRKPANPTNKISVFQDPTLTNIPKTAPVASASRSSENTAVDMSVVYPAPGEEYSLEEILARSRGFEYSEIEMGDDLHAATEDKENLPHDSTVHGEPQEMQTPLKEKRDYALKRASPTINTKAALADIIDIFNKPLKCEQSSDESSDDESTYDETTYNVTQKKEEITAKEDVEESSLPNPDAVRQEVAAPAREENDLCPPESGDTQSNDAQDNQGDVPELSEKHQTPSTPSHCNQPGHVRERRPAPFPLMTPINEGAESLPLSTSRTDHPSPINEGDQSTGTIRGPDYEDNDLREPGADGAQASDCDEDNTECGGLPEEPASSPFVENPTPRLSVTANGSSTGTPLMSKLEIATESDDTFEVGKKPTKETIITDEIVDPMNPGTRKQIYEGAFPRLTSYNGFHDFSGQAFERLEAIEKFSRSLSKKSNEGTMTFSFEIELGIPDFEHIRIKRKLGEGAYAPVFLTETCTESTERITKALKIEKPSSPWEFYILRQAKRRLGISRACDSIIKADCVCTFSNVAFLILEYRDQGTLLDAVNISKAEGSVGMDELLVMFFTIELLRTVEALHRKGILHGDLKADNCLVRLENISDNEWDTHFAPDGSRGWASKGLSLIDFGRAIDMNNFGKKTQFIADWDATQQDCAEIKEMRPWTYQIDYHGIACIVHSLLFGKYIETIRESAPGRKSYRLSQPFKRYWQQDIWKDLFNVLLNPANVAGDNGLPVNDHLRDSRVAMEQYVEAHCERGAGLKNTLRKLEIALAERKVR